MKVYPHTIMDFEKDFSTEEDCEEYLYSIRWKNGFDCPYCHNTACWKMTDGNYRCTKCRKKTSIISGTLFQDSKKSILLWFRAMWLLTNQKQGLNAVSLKNTLGFGNYESAWLWMHKLRTAMVRKDRDKLSGNVEIDEIYLGGERPGNRGRGAFGKTLILVITEINENKVGRIRLKIVPDASYKSLSNAITELVEKNSLLNTDAWPSYNQIKNDGFRHHIIRKTESVGENLLPHCNLVASLLKRWLLGTLQGGVKKSHLSYYLDEFTFRFNRRKSKSRGLLFYRLVEQAIEKKPLIINKK